MGWLTLGFFNCGFYRTSISNGKKVSQPSLSSYFLHGTWDTPGTCLSAQLMRPEWGRHEGNPSGQSTRD